MGEGGALRRCDRLHQDAVYSNDSTPWRIHDGREGRHGDETITAARKRSSPEPTASSPPCHPSSTGRHTERSSMTWRRSVLSIVQRAPGLPMPASGGPTASTTSPPMHAGEPGGDPGSRGQPGGFPTPGHGRPVGGGAGDGCSGETPVEKDKFVTETSGIGAITPPSSLALETDDATSGPAPGA